MKLKPVLHLIVSLGLVPIISSCQDKGAGGSADAGKVQFCAECYEGYGAENDFLYFMP